jgi:hypothetical protein
MAMQGVPFTSLVDYNEYTPPQQLNPECAAFCRSSQTQYYAVIDWPGRCFCGNKLVNQNIVYDAPACVPCGNTNQGPDEGYATGPGMCGDYWNGGVAVYSLDF